MVYYIILYFIVLYCTILYFNIGYYIILYYIVLYCILLYFIVLYCIILYYIISTYNDMSTCPLAGGWLQLLWRCVGSGQEDQIFASCQMRGIFRKGQETRFQPSSRASFLVEVELSLCWDRHGPFLWKHTMTLMWLLRSSVLVRPFGCFGNSWIGPQNPWSALVFAGAMMAMSGKTSSISSSRN